MNRCRIHHQTNQAQLVLVLFKISGFYTSWIFISKRERWIFVFKGGGILHPYTSYRNENPLYQGKPVYFSYFILLFAKKMRRTK